MSFLQFIEILRARIWIGLSILMLTVLTTTVASLILPKEYTANVSLVADFKGVDPVTGITLPAQLLPGYMATQVDIMTSHNVALKVVDRFKMAELPELQADYIEENKEGAEQEIRDWLADSLLKKLDVKPSRESNVIQLNYSGNDPRFAATLANAFAESYIATLLELKTEPAKQYTAWFEQQIKGLREKLEGAQGRLSQYQRDAGIVALDERLDVETAKLTELARQLAAAQSQALDARSRKGSVSEDSPDVLSNSLIQKLKAELALAEAKLAEATTKYGTHHPIYQQALAEIQTQKQKLAAEIKTVANSLSTSSEIASKREEDFKKAFAEQKSKILELNKQKDEITVLTREVDNAQQAYMSALQRFNQTRLESEANQTNVAILNQAIAPLKPSKPKVLLNIALSVFLGTMLAVGSLLLLELLDRRIRSVEDLAVSLEIPVLGVLINEKRAAVKSSL